MGIAGIDNDFVSSRDTRPVFHGWQDSIVFALGGFIDGSAGKVTADDAFAVQAALRGQGATLGWHHLVRDYIARDQLVKLTDHVYASGRKFYLFRNYTRITPALDIFEQWVREMYSGD